MPRKKKPAQPPPAKRPFRQVVVTWRYAGEGDWLVQLEVMRLGEEGPRRCGVISLTEGKRLILGRHVAQGRDVPLCVILDWLEENPDAVAGLPAAEVNEAVAAVRVVGNWFCM